MSAPGLEARVGILVISAVLVLVGFVLLLGDFTLQRTFPARVDFGFAGTLRAGAPVKVSGIKVGSVERMRLLAPGEAAAAPVGRLGQQARALVRAELSMFESARPLLTEGARFSIGTQGVIGEAYVELTPGAPGAPALAETAVRGVDAPELHVMALQVAALLDTFGAFLGGADSQLGAALTRLLNVANEVLGEHKAELSSAVSSFAASAALLRDVLAELRQAVGDGRLASLVSDASGAAQALERELPTLLLRTKESVATIDALTKRVSSDLDDAAVKGIITDLSVAANNLAVMSREGRALVQGIQRGDGTVGGLVRDPQIYDDLKELLRDLKKNPWKVLWRD